MYQQRRKTNRNYIISNIRISEGDKTIGYVINISRGGFLIMSRIPLVVEKEYHLRMWLPAIYKLYIWKHIHRNVHVVDFNAVCKWVNKVPAVNDFNVSGLKFCDLNIDCADIVRMMIKDRG